jgi:hypothetical protein
MSDNEMDDEIDVGVEDNSMKDISAAAKKPYEATPKEASFFFSVLKNCRSKPDVRQTITSSISHFSQTKLLNP